LKASDRVHRPSHARLWVVLSAGAVALLAVAGAVALLLRSDSSDGVTPPVPVSHVDTATRACLLTSTDSDTTGTWAAMREMARTRGTNVVVQRYRLPASADAVAYINTLVQLRCSTVVTTGTVARSEWVRIPMAHGVDSLNVGAAAAVAFYAVATGRPEL
jgi:hypothetical protein